MRCDQCKHWTTKTHDWTADTAGFGWCQAVRERWVIEDEASSKRTDTETRIAALKTARAYVQDGSEYTAALLTGPDFFCALYAGCPTEPEC